MWDSLPRELRVLILKLKRETENQSRALAAIIFQKYSRARTMRLAFRNASSLQRSFNYSSTKFHRDYWNSLVSIAMVSRSPIDDRVEARRAARYYVSTEYQGWPGR
jgi:hypothetical protein